METIDVGAMGIIRASSDELDALEEMLTLESTGKKKFTLKLYERDGDLMSIPRCLLQDKKPIGKIFPTVDIKFIGKLRPEQDDIVGTYMTSLFSTNPYGGIIKSPTGSGKTVMALKIMSLLKYRTLVIVPTDRIMWQWVDRLDEFTNLEDKDIGIVRGPRCEFEDKKISIGMVHSLVQKQYPESMYCSFGHIVFDEIHVLGAETFSRAAPMFNCQIRTGLSATPRRKDGMGNVFRWHIGEIVTEYRKATSKPDVVVVDYYNIATHHKGCVWNGDFNMGRYFNKISINSDRNNVIAELIVKALSKGHRILVLSDRLRQLEILKTLLVGTYAVFDRDIGYCTADKKILDRKIILATYGSAGMGLDIPSLSCLVFATPRTDIEQPIGRILRVKENKKKPVVVDIVDRASFFMSQWFEKRMRFYEKYSDSIKVVKKETIYGEG